MSKLKFPKSQEFIKRVKQSIPGGVHYNFRYSGKDTVIPFNKGRGSRIWDLDGNEHIDLFCKFGALLIGHHNTEYNSKLKEYMEKVLSVDQCDLEPQVCERIIHHVPGAEMVRFCLSGTEAVQNAIRLGRAYADKPMFVRFRGHYHGNADNIMGGKPQSDDYPAPTDYEGDFLGTEGRAPNIREVQSFILPWNNIEALEQLLADHADRIGVIIMEPICINGGGILPKPGYLERVRELCDHHHITLIFDEVITGFRTALGGAQSLLGVTPDITVFGKALAGGVLPVSAIAGKKEVMQLYTDQRVIHAGTFNGYPLGLAGILATIELLENEPNAYERMGNILLRIGQSLVDAAKAVDIPMVVQGIPNILVFHSQSEPLIQPEGYDDDTKLRDILITRLCKEYGIQFSPISRIYSNLLMEESDVEFFQSRIGEAMNEVKKITSLFESK